MSHENGKALYYVAAATSATGALMIRRPWAYYVTLMIGLMISDPGQMSESAKAWRTTDNGGSTSELIALRGELSTLRNTLKEEGKWEGEAFERFDAAYQDFNKSLKMLETTRNSTGEAVDQSAKLFFGGAVVCNVIADFMFLYGVALMLLRYNVYGNFIAQALDIQVSKVAVQSVKKVLIRHGIAVGVLSTVMYQAMQMAETSGKLFPTMKSLPTELSNLKSGGMAEFTNSGLEYDEQAGSLTPKVDDSLSKGILGPG